MDGSFFFSEMKLREEKERNNKKKRFFLRSMPHQINQIESGSCEFYGPIS